MDYDINFFKRMLDSEKLILIGKMASSVAHEINNPIMIISNIISLLLEEVNEDTLTITIAPDSEKYLNLKDVLNQCDRISKITKNLLDFSRTKPSKPQIIDLESLLLRTFHFMETMIVKPQIQLKFSIETKSTRSLIKQDEIQQVFMNLLHNSIYALQKKYPSPVNDRLKKFIEIKVRNEEVDRHNGMKKFVVIDFFDDGIGMSEAIQSKIFQPFFSTKKTKESPHAQSSQGLGLGLPFCKVIIEDHGGFITFESKENASTVFHIYLPLHEEGTLVEESEEFEEEIVF